MKRRLNRYATLLIAIIGLCTTTRAVVWQWAVDTGVKKHGKAFLWVPPECRQVRGLIVGQQVILEKAVFEDPQIRAVAAQQDLAILFIVPGAIAYDDFGPDGRGEATYLRIVSELAEVSGYAEIATAPFLTIGHSGGALPAWRLAYWKPERCFGVIGLHAAPIDPPSHDPQARLEGVPLLVISGQYESWSKDAARSIEHHWRWCRGDILALRSRWDRALASVLVQPGAGHFNWDDDLARYVALFIRKAAQMRLPNDGSSALREIPLASGWLSDHTLVSPGRYPPAPYRTYAGDRGLAFWHLDEELAKVNEVYGSRDHGKKLQLVSFVEDGEPLEPAWIQNIAFSPVEGDGMTVRVEGGFVKETPAVFAVESGMRPLSHADGPVCFRLIGGWSGGGEQLGPNIFRIKFDRFMYARRRPGSLMIMAWHPGDERYGYAEQSCSINFPYEIREGVPQLITFASIPDQPVGAGPIALNASADSGLPVEFFVVKGPAVIREGQLELTGIPPRTNLPVEVTVAACQWGRTVAPLVQSAAFVERSFRVGTAAEMD
ncbi:hypothetical protein PDESU_04812 [Pontiella desulfatans]|uniref:Uncharacterized protein n=1 Tax=Pontiella desulfatans TaxID=2750659 RepID=A0A6C2U9M5_PONDE|nr:hypothetical protein [Pontiella desulfatans]VGO16221.1 hypothetical protein PDESU_04812 [Pontiella desulfatans]